MNNIHSKHDLHFRTESPPHITLRHAFGVPLCAVGVVVSADYYGTNRRPHTQVDTVKEHSRSEDGSQAKSRAGARCKKTIITAV